MTLRETAPKNQATRKLRRQPRMGYIRKLAEYPAGEPARGWADGGAACRNDERFDWYADKPVYGTGLPPGFWKHARQINARKSAEQKKVCASCPVRDDCLRQALSEGDGSAAFRAGLTVSARKRILKAHQDGEFDDIEKELVKAGWSDGDAASMVRSFE